MSFGVGVAKYAKRVNLSLDKAVVSICTQATTSIIKRSPFDTGRFRGNWFASIDKFSDETSETRSESVALSDGIAIAQKASGHIFTLKNNLPYAMSLEYGLYPKTVKYGTRLKEDRGVIKFEVRSTNGFSAQAPHGMVRITKLELENKLRKI